jgi:hypothetical protein
MRESLRLLFIGAMFFAVGCGPDIKSEPDAPPVKVPDAAPIVCGDGVCSTSELGQCVPDCGGTVTCNDNGTCDPGEMNLTPACADCPSTACDNDLVCDAGETEASCPGDCPPAATCNMDGTCDANEDMATCVDCGGGGPVCMSNSDCTVVGECCFLSSFCVQGNVIPGIGCVPG